MTHTKQNRKPVKLIAIDMDGTLLNDRHEISEDNRKAIKQAQEKGIHVVISTGRTRMTCDELVDSLSLSTYLITVNGSEIWDGTRTLVERQLLDSKVDRAYVGIEAKISDDLLGCICWQCL